MVVCFDTAGVTYAILSQMTIDVTGSFFLTTLVVSFLLMAIAGLFGIPIEYTMILLLPLHLGLLACLGSDWLALTGTFLIYLGILLGKNFFFRT